MAIEDQEVEIITISQEDGAEEDFEVVTYFEHPETGIKYVFLVSVADAEEEEQDIYPFRYAENGDDLVLAPVEEDEEWEMLEEVLQTLLDSDEI
jgi:uncharacterized protein YrzB (UPF0473 family)